MFVCDLEFSKNDEHPKNKNYSSIYNFQIFAAMNHSVTLVWIIDWLSDSPIGVVHLLLVQPSTLSCFGSLDEDIVLGETTRRCADCSSLRRFDPFLKGSTHPNKRWSMPHWRSTKWTWWSSSFYFFVLFNLFAPFYDIVYMLSLHLQIFET